jgi:hypothetical protein
MDKTGQSRIEGRFRPGAVLPVKPDKVKAVLDGFFSDLRRGIIQRRTRNQSSLADLLAG